MNEDEQYDITEMVDGVSTIKRKSSIHLKEIEDKSYILSMREKMTACCSSFNLVHLSSSFFCVSVSVTGVSPSAKSCERVMPNAPQIFSSEGIVGIIFFRYQEDMVD